MPKELWKATKPLPKPPFARGWRPAGSHHPTDGNPQYLSRHMPELGRAFVQAESELGAINMVYGAACTGVRVMSSSSSRAWAK